MANGKRPNLGRKGHAPNSANENSPVMQRLNAGQLQNLNQKIKAPARANIDSKDTVIQERAFMYNQMGRNRFMQKVNQAFDRMDRTSKLTPQRRKELSYEAQEFSPYFTRAYDKNKSAIEIESTGTKLRVAAAATNMVDAIGSAVMLANPAAGIATKAAAKGATIGLKAGATAAYDRASHAYGQNVNESETGMGMLDSHISKAKSDLTRTRRDKMIIETGTEVAAAGLTTAMGFSANGAVSYLRRVGNQLGSSKKTSKEREDKAEIVNLMRHQQGRETPEELHKTRPNPYDLETQKLIGYHGKYAGTQVGQLKRQNAGRNFDTAPLDAKEQRKQAYKRFGAPTHGTSRVKP